MLEARIEKQVGTFTLRVELSAQRETLALLGASGAGKTMTLLCLAGVLKPDRGFIRVDGTDWFDSERHVFLPPQERAVGLLFQNYALFPNMTVWQNLMCGLRRDTPPRERKARARELVDRFCLDGLEDRLPRQLSGGQQQRVALARCLARKPRLLLLDEPFAALDAHLRWQLEQELKSTLDAFTGSTLYITHDRDEARRLCDRVCVIQAGRAQPAVDTGVWYRKPATRSAAQLAGFENIASALPLAQGDVRMEEWGVQWSANVTQAEAVAFRAEDARFTGSGEDFVIPCRILRSTEQETLVTPIDRPYSYLRAAADGCALEGMVRPLFVARNRVVWLSQEE